MAEFIPFNTNGVVKRVAADFLVLKERDCTQTGTSYHVMEMGSLSSNPEDAYYVAQVVKDDFERLRKQFPRAPLLRIGTD